MHDVRARIHDRSARVAVLGQGYVGLVVAMRASEAGFHVVGLGLSYKPNVGDWRESPSLPLIDGLLALGAEVTAVDPHVEGVPLPASVRLVATPDREQIDTADVVIVVSDHDAFDYAVIAEHASRILDTRHRFAAGATNVGRL